MSHVRYINGTNKLLLTYKLTMDLYAQPVAEPGLKFRRAQTVLFMGRSGISYEIGYIKL